MPAGSSVRDSYPPVSRVEDGEIGRAREAFNSACDRNGQLVQKTAGWDRRLREIEVLIDRATPEDTDFVRLAAAIAERDVLTRHREAARYDETRRADDMHVASITMGRLENEYNRALGVLIDVDEGRGSGYYDRDIQRARQDLVRHSGIPGA